MKAISIGIFFSLFAFAASFFPEHAPILIHWINTLGYVAPLFFLGLYCLATLLFMPTMVLTLAGGALFGPLMGTLFNVLGATLGAAAAFAVSRYWLSHRFQTNPKSGFDKIIHGVEKRGWQFVALVRLVPIIPFNLVNYGLGLTNIKFSHYVVTTFLFLIPLEIISTYCGYAGMEILVNSSVLYKRAFFGVALILVGVYLVHLLLKRKKTL